MKSGLSRYRLCKLIQILVCNYRLGQKNRADNLFLEKLCLAIKNKELDLALVNKTSRDLQELISVSSV